MKKFLLKSALVLLVGAFLLLDGIGISAALRDRTFQPHDNYFCNDFRKGYHEGLAADIVLLGNSRVLSGLSATEMEKLTGARVLQLGYSSSNISITRLVLESYLRKAKKPPETAILEVSWFTFNPDRTGFHSKFAGDLAMNDPCLLRYSGRYPELFQSWALRLAEHALTGQALPYTDYTIAKRMDYPVNDSTVKDYTLDTAAMERIFPDHIAGVDRQLLEDFNAIVDLCSRRQIRLVLYTGPEDAGFTAMQRDRDAIRRIYLAAGERPGVTYMDYTSGGTYYRSSFENILLNSDHIYFDDIFTRRFTADLKTAGSDE